MRASPDGARALKRAGVGLYREPSGIAARDRYGVRGLRGRNAY